MIEWVLIILISHGETKIKHEITGFKTSRECMIAAQELSFGTATAPICEKRLKVQQVNNLLEE